MKILLKEGGGGTVNYLPIGVFGMNLRRPDVKRGAEYLSLGGRVRCPEAFVQYLTRCLPNMLSLRPRGKQPGSDFFDLGGGGVFSSGLCFPAGIQGGDAAQLTGLALLEESWREQGGRGRRNTVVLTG